MQMGRSRRRERQGHFHQNILPVLSSVPHSGRLCPLDRHPSPTRLREKIYCGNQFEEEGRGGEVVSRQKRLYNIHSQELVVVKFVFVFSI